MNTVSRLDTYLTALLVPTLHSTSSSHPNARASSSKVRLDSPSPSNLSKPGPSDIASLPDVTQPGRPRPIRRPSSPSSRRGRSRRRRKPTTSSIKLPPPSTPFFLRIALGLWSILLSFWMSLVGEIRAERAQRRKRRRVRSAASGAIGAVGGISSAEPGIGGQGIGAGSGATDEQGDAMGMGGMSSDEGSGTELDGEGDGEGEHDGEQDADKDGEVAGVDRSDEDDGWVDPVTRAPAGMGDEIDTPGEEEFAEGADASTSSSRPGSGSTTSRFLQRTYSPSLTMSHTSTTLGGASGSDGSGSSGKAEPDAISFRLRSAERRHRDSLPSAAIDEAGTDASPDPSADPSSASQSTASSTNGTTHTLFPSVHINPPTPPKLAGAFQPSSILTNPSHPSSLPPYPPAGPSSNTTSHRRSGTDTPPSRPSSPTRTRSNRLLANPISTSLLDPSKPAPSLSSLSLTSSGSAAPAAIPRMRPHTTPFHLQKTLILDLDETLIHSTSRPMAGGGAGGGMLGVNLGALLGGRKKRREGHTVEVVIGGRSTTYHVYKRPYVDLFLKKVATWYTLVIYTASMPEYADPVIDWLDAGRSLFAKRLYRDSCFLQTNGSYIKDLALVEKDLSRVCFMDNSPVSYAWNKANALPIEGWTSDPYDEALLQSLPVLDCLRFVNDVRRILGIRGFF